MDSINFTEADISIYDDKFQHGERKSNDKIYHINFFKKNIFFFTVEENIL